MHYFTPALNKLVRQKIVHFYPFPHKHTLSTVLWSGGLSFTCSKQFLRVFHANDHYDKLTEGDRQPETVWVHQTRVCLSLPPSEPTPLPFNYNQGNLLSSSTRKFPLKQDIFIFFHSAQRHDFLDGNTIFERTSSPSIEWRNILWMLVWSSPRRVRTHSDWHKEW